ncbi:MAG: hypothetical protein ACFE8E_09990 [Candidatus Hodarchaeota archaeon]
MQDDKKFKKLKAVLILIFIFLCIPVTLLYLFLRDISELSIFFSDYFGSGSSIFIPFLPKINLLWFLPEPFFFSLGHLIDIVILINAIGYIQTSIYHYFVKKVYLNVYSRVLMDLNVDSLGSKELIYFSIQDSEILFNHDNSLNYLPNNNDFQIKNHSVFQIKEKDYKFHFNENFKNKILRKRPKYFFRKYHKVFGNPSILLFLKSFRIFHLLIKFYRQSTSNRYLQMEGGQ